MNTKRRRKKYTKQKHSSHLLLALVFVVAMAAILFGILAYGYLSLRDASDKTQGMVEGGEVEYEETYQDHKEYRGNDGRFQTRNLAREDLSFEVGLEDAFDAMSVVRRMHYDHYNPGTQEIFSTDESKGFIRPVITADEAFHGAQSLKIDNRNADGVLLDLNWVQVPTTGKYVFSAYLKSADVGGAVDSDTNCNNTDVFINMQVLDKDFNSYASGTGDHHIIPGAWVRKHVTTASDLQAGEFYRMQLRISNTERPLCFGKGTLYVDAVQFEYAQNQSSPSPSEYVYPSSEQELFAYASSDADGESTQYGNIFFAGDQSNIYAHLQVKEEGQLPGAGAPAKLKWWLYDLNGDSNNTSTALSEGVIDVSHAASNFQTQHINLSQVLQEAAPTKEAGVMKMVIELWNNGESEMHDKEFLNFAILKRSPYANQDMPDGFFGNHLLMVTSNGAYDRYIIDTPRSPSEVVDFAKDLGFHHSREFYLLDKENIENGLDSDPFLDDYVDMMIAHHFRLLPVIPAGGADADWQEFVATAAAHYGDKINEYEVLNEPDMPHQAYYEYLWRAYEAIQAESPQAVVSGPSAFSDMFDELLDYDGGHGVAYDLFESFAIHSYPPFTDQGMRLPPEVESIEKYEEFVERIHESAPGGVNTKPYWVTEFGRNHSRLYDDIPVITGSLWGQPIVHRPHMSGSLPLGRTMASSLVRSFYYQLTTGMTRTYYFGMQNPRIYDVGLYGFLDFDGTPLESVGAISYMTQTLEGAEFVREIIGPELKTNGVLSSTSRAILFNVPDHDDPGSTKPLAIVFNWDEIEDGAALNAINLETSNVSVRDFEGNPIALTNGATFSLPFDEAPVYLFGENDTTMEQLALALDTIRPLPVARPTVSVVDDQVLVRWGNSASNDVSRYAVYRAPAGGGSDVRIAEVDEAGTGGFTEYYDQPATGLWVYKVAAIEEGSNYEALSPASLGISLNLAPEIEPIDDLNVHEQSAIEFLIIANDPDESDTLSFSSEGMPSGANLTDNENGTATFSWNPSLVQSGAYAITITVTDSDASDSDEFAITVIDGVADCTPNWVCSEWSVCSENLQYRTCTDENACGTDDGRPPESRLCDSVAPSQTTDLRPN